MKTSGVGRGAAAQETQEFGHMEFCSFGRCIVIRIPYKCLQFRLDVVGSRFRAWLALVVTFTYVDSVFSVFGHSMGASVNGTYCTPNSFFFSMLPSSFLSTT